jgi:hypothetical protein
MMKKFGELVDRVNSTDSSYSSSYFWPPETKAAFFPILPISGSKWFFFGSYSGFGGLSFWKQHHEGEDEHGALVKCYWPGKAEVLVEEPALCPTWVTRIKIHFLRHSNHTPTPFKNSLSLVCRKVITDYCDNHKRHMTLWASLILMDPCIVEYSVEIPTRCSFVIEFIIPKFIEESKCFERHTAHHQEL